MNDPSVRVYVLCELCVAEQELVMPLATLQSRRLWWTLYCATCKAARAHYINPLKLPAEDA